MAPDSMSSLALANDGWVVEIAPHERGTPAAAHAATILSASARVWHIGLSVTIAFTPRSTAMQVSPGLLLVFVAIATMSKFSFASISAASV